MDSMGAKNLLYDAKKVLGASTIEDDGVFHNKYAATDHTDLVYWSFDGPLEFDDDNTFYVALSVKGAAASANTLGVTLQCKDSDGNTYWRSSGYFPITEEWTRVEGTITIPEGSAPVVVYIAEESGCPELWVTSPTLTHDSPVTLASSAHTPYATDGHLKAVYATQASLKVQSDRITSEVSARAQTDKAVSALSTRVTQTETDVIIAIQDASTAVSTAKAAASDAATAKTDAGKASSDAAAAIAETKDLVTLRIDSSRGTVFKNNLVSTVLTVRCYKRGQELTTLEALRQAMLDETARIRWYVLREGDTDWVSLADSDHMLSNDGFTLTVTPDDVSVKCTFKAEIVTD